MANDKAIKAAIKEGGKKGVDLAGVSAMGGVCFFNLAVETPEGDLDLLQAVIDGSNTEVDESAEERKGGAGDIGKIFLSAGDKQLAIIAHVPKELQTTKNVTIDEWVAAVTKPLGDVTVVSKTDELIKITVAGNAEKGLFPLKMRDEAISAGFAFLKEKGLIPIADSSDDEVNYAEAAGVEW